MTTPSITLQGYQHAERELAHEGEEVPAEQQDAVRALWDPVQQQFASTPVPSTCRPTASSGADSHRWGG